MEKLWLFGETAVSAALVDFLDPELAGPEDVRERGVRVEVRPVHVGAFGSIYSSPEISLKPAVLRIDILESAPRRADRMHYHPDMVDGEPGDRTFDISLSDDPIAWLTAYLENLQGATGGADVAEIADAAGAIASEVAELLQEAREPWPDVVHDERGLVVG